jgi:hypothetical protein
MRDIAAVNHPASRLTPGQLAKLRRALERGEPRPEALRQAGIDPIRFAAEYRHSSALAELVARAEGRPSVAAAPVQREYVPPLPDHGSPHPDVPSLERPSAWSSEPATPVPSSEFDPALWLVVLAPLLIAVMLLVLGAGAGAPSLSW